MADWPHTMTLKFCFETPEHANIVRRCTSVDPEVRPNLVQRASHVEGRTLITQFDAKDLRSLRVSLGMYLELVELSIRTVQDLSPETFVSLPSASPHACPSREELDQRRVEEAVRGETTTPP